MRKRRGRREHIEDAISSVKLAVRKNRRDESRFYYLPEIFQSSRRGSFRGREVK